MKRNYYHRWSAASSVLGTLLPLVSRIVPLQDTDSTFRLTASLGFASVWRGQNELEVSRRVPAQTPAGPIKLVKAQLWVKFK